MIIARLLLPTPRRVIQQQHIGGLIEQLKTVSKAENRESESIRYYYKYDTCLENLRRLFVCKIRDCSC